MPNFEKGFTIVALVIFVALISASIIGGSFIVKTKYPQLLKNKSIPVTQETSSQSSATGTSVIKDKLQVSSSAPKIPYPELNNKLLYPTKDGLLSLTSADGKNITKFLQPNGTTITADTLTQSRVSISPDLKRILFVVPVKYDPQHPGNLDYAVGIVGSSYVASTDGKIITKIDLAKFNPPARSGIFFLGWSTDNRLVYRSFVNVGGNNVKNTIGVFDVDSGKIEELYSKVNDSGDIYLLFCDPIKKVLAFYDHSGLNNTGYLVNLETKAEQPLDVPNVVNYGSNSYYTNPYFVTSDAANYSKSERKKLFVHSYYDPKKVIAQIELKEVDKNYTATVIWSPQFNFFAIPVMDKISSSSAMPKNGILKIYNRTGEEKLTKNFTFPDFYGGGSLFSNDEKYFLMSGISTSEDKVPSDTPVWQTFDISTGNIFTPRVVSPDLGLQTVYWFN